MSSLDDLRIEYQSEPLERSDLDDDPVVQFQAWLDDAARAGVEEPNAFVLATVGGEEKPSARTVLLKAFDQSGLVFYTNYESRKAGEMAVNPSVAGVFLWQPLHRQVRIEGLVTKVEAAVSDAYFESRPLEARLASAASPQSRVVTDRATLENLMAEIKTRFPDGDVPRPDHWGGYRLLPDYYEFWQGREARFHDRFRYTTTASGWQIERLAP